MATLSLKYFRWRRVINGYRLSRPRDSASERIFANNGREVAYFPFSNADNLYALFARVDSTAHLMDFVRKFGPLTSAGFNKSPRQPEDLPFEIDLRPLADGPHDFDTHFRIIDQIGKLAWNYDPGGEDVEADLKEASLFRNILQNIGHPTRMRSIFAERSWTLILRPALARRSIALDRPEARIELWPDPGNLLGALWWQLFHKLSGEANIRTCLHCGQWFDVGPGTNKRLDAKFCSDKHRVLFNSLKRSKGN
jgi:hypothetical protein